MADSIEHGGAAPPVTVHLNVVGDDLLRRMQSSAHAISECPNFWMPREAIEEGHCLVAAEEVVVQLHRRVLRSRLPPDWAGAEYWVQVYERGRGLAFHFDKDEHAMKERGAMITPHFSSVLYLTGSASDGLRQSPTVVIDQRFDPEQGRAVPESPTESTLVFPVANTYCLFDGALGHGVLDSSSAATRCTLLVNWWARKPEAIDRLREEEVVERGLAASAGGAEPSEGSDSEAPSTLQIPRVAVPAEEVEQDSHLLVDDLLQQRGIAVAGAGAVHAVTVAHAGLSLCPIDSDQLAEADLQVGAAFVTPEEEEEEEGCGSSEEEEAQA